MGFVLVLAIVSAMYLSLFGWSFWDAITGRERQPDEYHDR